MKTNKSAIQVLTGMIIAGGLMGLSHLIEWDVYFRGLIAIGVFVTATVLHENFVRLYSLYISKRFINWHGKKFTANVCGVDVSGKVSIQYINKNTFAYLNFNEDIENVEYAVNDGNFGFKHSWFISIADNESLNIAGVTNLKIDKK